MNPVIQTEDCDRTETPLWLKALAWPALLTLALLPAFPRTVGALNFAAALGIIPLCYWCLLRRNTIIPNRWLRYALLLFLLSCLFSVIYPLYRSLPDREVFISSTRSSWHSLKGVIAAGLCLLLLRRREDFGVLLCFAAMTTLLVVLWAPLHHWFLKLHPAIRLTGTRGYETRYTTLLYLMTFFIGMLALSPAIRRVELPRWASIAGYFIPVATAIMLFRKRLPVGYRNRFFTWDHPEGALDFVFLAIGIGIAGTILWHLVKRPGRMRLITPSAVYLLILINVAMAATRLRMAMIILAGIAGVVLLTKRRAPAVIAVFLAGCLGIALLLTHPHALNSLSMRHRLYIWEGTKDVIAEHWLLGAGYGTDAFSREWEKHIPDPDKFDLTPYFRADHLLVAAHAHNLWLELLAERGIPGLLSFHLLWLACILSLRKRGQSMPVPAMLAIVLMAGLLLEGSFTWSLQRGNEILYWIIAATGIASIRIEKTLVEESNCVSP